MTKKYKKKIAEMYVQEMLMEHGQVRLKGICNIIVKEPRTRIVTDLNHFKRTGKKIEKMVRVNRKLRIVTNREFVKKLNKGINDE